MAKFAVLLFAAFAFQAAFAGVVKHQEKLGGYKYGGKLEGYQGYDNLVGQIQTVAQELTESFQTALPNNRQVFYTLAHQSREFAQYLDTIIDLLQREEQNYTGKTTSVLEKVITHLRKIQASFYEAASYTDVSKYAQLKKQFYTNVQVVAEQLEKLALFVPTDLAQSQGSFHDLIKNVVVDFLHYIKHIRDQVQYFAVQGTESPRQLALEIQEVTEALTGYFQEGQYFQNQQVKLALRQYVQYVEAIISKLQEVEGTVGNVEFDNVIQRVYNKLRLVLVPLRQLIEGQTIENVDVVKSQLIKEFHIIAEVLEQLVQYAQTGNETLIYEVLGDYLSALHHVRIQLQGGFYGQFYQGEFYGKNGLQGQFYGYQGLYKNGGYQGLYAKYQAFGKYGQSGKQYVLEIQTIARELAQYLKTISVDDVQAKQTLVYLIREYAQELEAIIESLQQVSYKTEAGVYDFQQLAQNLRQIVVSFEQLYNAEAISVKELRTQFYLYVQRSVEEFEKFYSGVQSYKQTGTYYTLVQNVLEHFLYATRTLVFHVQHIAQGQYTREYTPFAQYGQGYGYGNQYYGQQYGYGKYGQGYGYGNQYYGQQYGFGKYGQGYGYGNQYYGQQYGSGKYGQGYQYRQYGQYYGGLEGRQYTPRQLVAEIEYVAKDLSATLQNSMINGQQAIEVLSVQARHFAQTIKAIVNQLEGQLNNDYEHVEVIQQVIYKLREVYAHFEKLVAYNTFSNVHQLRAEFDQYIQIAVAQFEKLAFIVQEQTEGEYYYVIKNVLNTFLNGLQDFHYQVQEFAYNGQFTQYGKGYGYGKYGQQYGQGYGYGNQYYGQQYGYGKYYGQQYGSGKYYGQQYGFGKYGQGNQYNKYGQYYGGLEGRQYTPRQLVAEIEYVAKDLSETLQNSMLTGQQATQYLTVQVRQFAQTIKNIINQLEGQLNNDYEHVEIVQEVIYKLREVYAHFEKLVAYNTFSNVHQLRAEFDQYIQIAVAQFEKLAFLVQEQTEGKYYYVIKSVLNFFLNGLQDFHYQIQEFAYNGQFTQYGKGYGYGKYGQQYGQGYGYGKQYYGQGYGYGNQYYGQQYGKSYGQQYGQGYGKYYGQYYGGLEGRQYTPKQLVAEIEYVAKDLSATLENSMLTGQKAVQVLSVQARQFAQIIKNVLIQLEGQLNNGFEHVELFQQVIYKLREVQLAFEKLAAYNVFTNVHQLRAEFDQYIHIAIAQFERLVVIAQEETQGNYYYVIKSVLNFFLNGLQDFHYQIQEFAYNGQYSQYGQQYGKYYGQQYGQGYGYGKYYGQQYDQQYGQGYGYGKYYGQQYGQQYGQGYGYGKYGQEYGLNKYGQGYGYGKQYYGRQYGVEGSQYGYEFQGKTTEQLVNHIQVIANQVAEELQTVDANDKQVRQVLLVQARELIQVIDYIVEKLEVETYGKGNIVQQVVSNLRQYRVELQQIVESGVITTVYQIKAQIARNIQYVASELQKFALVAQSEFQQVQIVKDVLTQYVVYLRNVQNQLQYNTVGYQNTKDLASGDYYTQYFRNAIRGY